MNFRNECCLFVSVSVRFVMYIIRMVTSYTVYSFSSLKVHGADLIELVLNIDQHGNH